MADRICERLLEGRSLKAICTDRGMPAASTVFRWLAEDPVFAGRYAMAKQAQADALFEEILEIADAEDGDVPRARLKIDTRKELNASIRWMRSPEPPSRLAGRRRVTERDDG